MACNICGAVFAEPIPADVSANDALSTTGAWVDELENLDLVYESKNIQVTNRQNEKYDDVSRAYPQVKNTEAYLVYKIEDISVIKMTAFVSGYEYIFRINESNKNPFTFQISEDGNNWTSIQGESSVTFEHSWRKYIYSVDNIPAETKYFKVNISTIWWSSMYIGPDECQIGSIAFFPAGETSDIPLTISRNSGTVSAFADDFDKLNSSWTVADQHTDFVSIATVDGRSCLDIHTSAELSSAGAADPYITLGGLNLSGDVYSISLDIMCDNMAFDRYLMIGANTSGGVGQYIYPLCFGTNGTIGYRNANNVFCNFDTPVTYEPGKWYTITAVVDMANAKLVVYVDGKKLSTQETVLLSGTEGGINEIRIVNNYAATSGHTYVDRIEINRELNFQAATHADENQIVTFLDSYNSWAKKYIVQLTALGIMNGYGDGTFRPDENITVEEFVKCALNASGIFVTGVDWSEAYMQKAKELGVIRNGEFDNSERDIQRQEAARILVRLFAKQIDQTKLAFYQDTIQDWTSIDQSFQEEVLAAYANGFLTGDQNGAFRSTDAISRAETAAIIVRAMDESVRDYGLYTVGIYADESYRAIANDLKSILESSGFEVQLLQYDDMYNYHALDAERLDCLVCLNAVEEEFVNVFRGYLENGGDLVVAGPEFFNLLNTKEFVIPIFEGMDYEPYLLEGVRHINVNQDQNIVSLDCDITGNYSGSSAVGFPFPDSGEYIPLLEATDEYGHNLGHAAGILTNYDGRYIGSDWLFYGIAEKDFYSHPDFINSVAKTMETFRSRTLDTVYTKEKLLEKNLQDLNTYEITEEKPPAGVTVSADGKTLVDPWGEELFLIGASVFGPMEYYNFVGHPTYGTYSVEKLETLFREANEIGVNCFRFWNIPTDEQPAKVIKNLARKYKIYIYPCIQEGFKDNRKEELETIEKIAKAYGDEPMVIGYDLWNEPYLPQLLFRFGGNDASNPMLKYDFVGNEIMNTIPPGKTSTIQSTYNYYLSEYTKSGGRLSAVANSSYPGLLNNIVAAESIAWYYLMTGSIWSYDMHESLYDPAQNGSFEIVNQLDDAINETITKGIDERRDLIRMYDSDALITIGYMSNVALYQANVEELDWWNHHLYTYPNSYEDVYNSLHTFDVLQNTGAEIPVILGEFGVNAGQELDSGEALEYDQTNQFNFAHWLYAYANGYGGAVNWELYTKRTSTRRYFFTTPVGKGETALTAKEHHGLLLDDGNTGKEMPIAMALKFFKDYIDRHNIGDGEFTLLESGGQSEAGWSFKDIDVEYAAATEYQSDKLKFSAADEDVPIVMLDWSGETIKAMSTKRQTVYINTALKTDNVNDSDVKISGLHGETNLQNGWLEITLLPNEIVNIAVSNQMVCTKF
ncbi:S-layer homology domain-containing protein [Ructibacterium gallinarum]|nr:S-layer homology domain-containing protein [Ructibacterium gallinarum]